MSFLLFMGRAGVADSSRCPALLPDQQQTLDRAARALFEAVRDERIDSLIELLADEVEIATDAVVSKEVLAQDLRAKQGLTYISLFDTARYRLLVETWQAESPHGRVPQGGSTRDLFKRVSKVDIWSCPMGSEGQVYRDAEGRIFVDVAFAWPGRPSVNDLENSVFVWTPQGWRISALFSQM